MVFTNNYVKSNLASSSRTGETVNRVQFEPVASVKVLFVTFQSDAVKIVPVFVDWHVKKKTVFEWIPR